MNGGVLQLEMTQTRRSRLTKIGLVCKNGQEIIEEEEYIKARSEKGVATEDWLKKDKGQNWFTVSGGT